MPRRWLCSTHSARALAIACLASLLATTPALAATATLAGSVTDPGGVPLAGAVVHVKYTYRTDSPAFTPVTVGSTGTYQLTLTDVPASGENYQAYAVLSGHEMVSLPGFNLQPSQQRANLHLKMVSTNPVLTVSGRVLDAHGAPVPNVPVTLRYVYRADLPAADTAYTNGDGDYRLTVSDVPATGENYTVVLGGVGCTGSIPWLNLQRGPPRTGMNLAASGRCGVRFHEPFNGSAPEDWNAWPGSRVRAAASSSNSVHE